MVKIKLPFLPISVNTAFATDWRTKRRYKTPRYKQFLEDCHYHITGKEKVSGEVQIEINFYWKDNRKRDLDNYLKTTLDMLVHYGLIEDDSKIRKLIVERGVDSPETWIEIAPYYIDKQR